MKKRKQNIKTAFIVLLAIIALLLLLMQNAAPGHPLYFVDRKIEDGMANIQFNDRGRLNYEIGLAEERIREAGTQYNRENELKALLDSYKQNIKNSQAFFEKVAKSKVSGDKKFESYQRLTAANRSFSRDLELYRNNVPVEDVKRLITTAKAETSRSNNETFEIALYNIEGSDNFNIEADSVLDAMQERLDGDIEFMAEGVAAVEDMVEPDEFERLNQMVVNAQENLSPVNFEKDLRERYEAYMHVDEQVKEIGAELARITQENAEIR